VLGTPFISLNGTGSQRSCLLQAVTTELRKQLLRLRERESVLMNDLAAINGTNRTAAGHAFTVPEALKGMALHMLE